MNTTFVVSCEAKSNWTVQDNTGASTDGFKNWVAAVDFARSKAVEVGATIVRLSAKDNRVVEHIAPRASVSAITKNAELVSPSPTDVNDVIAQIDPNASVLTEESLNALPTPALVAVYNANGGNISGKFKGARKSLVAKILANVA